MHIDKNDHLVHNFQIKCDISIPIERVFYEYVTFLSSIHGVSDKLIIISLVQSIAIKDDSFSPCLNSILDEFKSEMEAKK